MLGNIGLGQLRVGQYQQAGNIQCHVADTDDHGCRAAQGRGQCHCIRMAVVPANEVRGAENIAGLRAGQGQRSAL